MSEDTQDPNKYKRKRKKTFLRNARKYGKKGCYGRGSELDADTYQTLVRLMEVYKAGFPSHDDKVEFVRIAFENSQDKELDFCCNQIGCRFVETLLPFANDGVLMRYMETIGKDLRKLCSDRFASHVIEALLTECSVRINKPDGGNIDVFKNFTTKVSMFLLNNLEDYIWDTYGNHVLRTVLLSLAQMPKNDEKTMNKIEDETQVSNIPNEFSEIVKDYSQRLLTWPQFKDLAYSELTSGFLQTLLKVLKNTHPKEFKKYLKKLLEESFLGQENNEERTANKLPDVFMSRPAMMLLETCLELAKSKMYTQIYAKCFVGNLVVLAKMRSTNFAVQKLISNCKEKSEFEAMCDELFDHFKEVLENGHTGILLALAESCKRLCTKQGMYLQKIMECVNCLEPQERQTSFALCLSRFSTFEDAQSKTNENLQKEKLNLHGTLILQATLEFNKPIKVVSSLLNMEKEDLKNLFSNSMGSHIADSFFKSTFVGEKSREKLIRKLQGTYQDLASSKYGSRAFDIIWNVCSFKSKLSIMEELAHKNAIWSNSEFGRIIANKIHLPLYKRNKEEWKNSLGKDNKVNSLLNILD